MEKVHFMERLLEGVDVEWKKLGDVAIKISSGKNKDKSNSGKYPVYGSTGIIGRTDNKTYEQKQILVARVGANAGRVNIAEGEYDVSDNTLIIKCSKIIKLKFLYYYLVNINLNRFVKGAGQPLLTAGQLKKIPIPIPPLKVQSEIVRILDNFTELTAELTAELSARKKQYSYYRDTLLSFEEGEVEWKKLGDPEVGEFIRGKRFVKTDMKPEGIPCIHYGQMYTYYGIWANKSKSFVSPELVDAKKLRTAKKGDVIFVAAGETIEDIGMATAWFGDEDVVIHDACFFYKTKLNAKYIAYYTRTNFFKNQIRKSVSSGKISAINAKGLGKVIIPVPSPEEQERIVTILDKFDTLTNSISEGLPREIALRQKQYEYYRDLLLSFPKKEVEA